MRGLRGVRVIRYVSTPALIALGREKQKRGYNRENERRVRGERGLRGANVSLPACMAFEKSNRGGAI